MTKRPAFRFVGSLEYQNMEPEPDGTRPEDIFKDIEKIWETAREIAIRSTMSPEGKKHSAVLLDGVELMDEKMNALKEVLKEYDRITVGKETC